MYITIFESLSGSSVSLEAVEKALKQDKKLFCEMLKDYYKYDRLDYLNITLEQAIEINLGNIKTISKVYFANARKFSKMARWYEFNMSFGGRLYCAQDMLQQIFVDFKYYDLSSEKTVKSCIYRTFKTSNNGGVARYKNYRDDRKPSRFLYEEIKNHNSKMEAGGYLLDLLKAPEKTTNPEAIIIDNETASGYNKSMEIDILRRLHRSQRGAFIEAFGWDKTK